MVKLRAWIKENWKAIAVAVLLVVAAVAVNRACRVEDKYSKLVGVYEAYRAINKQVNADMKHSIAEKEKKIVFLNGQIKSLDADVKRLRLNLGIKDKALADLEALYPTLTDCTTQLANMTSQRNLWQGKYNDAEAIISDREQTIGLLNLQIDDYRAIAADWEKRYNAEIALRMAAEDAHRACRGKLRAASFWSNTKTVLVVVAAGYLIYQAVKK